MIARVRIISHGQSLCVRAFRFGYTTVYEEGVSFATFSRDTSRNTREETRPPPLLQLTYNTTTSRFLMIYQLEYVKRVHAELIQSDTLD